MSDGRAAESALTKRRAAIQYATPQQTREFKRTEFKTYQDARIELSNGRVWWELARCAGLHRATADDVVRRLPLAVAAHAESPMNARARMMMIAGECGAGRKEERDACGSQPAVWPREVVEMNVACRLVAREPPDLVAGARR